MVNEASSTGQEIQPYKFGGKELDEMHGLQWYDFGARPYDPLREQFITMDPLAEKYYSVSPYAYCANNPVRYKEMDGRFKLDANFAQQYPRLARYLEYGIQQVLDNPTIMASLQKHGQMSKENIEEGLTWGSGPNIRVTSLTNTTHINIPILGQHPHGTSNLLIQKDLIELLEKATGMEREAVLFLVGVTILHEFVHYGDGQDGEYISYPEKGEDFEKDAYGTVIGDIEAANYYLTRWLEKQQQRENEEKVRQLYNFTKDFTKIESGTYTWNGSSWQRVK
jgi:RHS repeat-associated protein